MASGSESAGGGLPVPPSLEQQLAEVEQEIRAVEKQIKTASDAADAAPSQDEKERLSTRETALRKKEEQLRKKEEQLRSEKEQLRDKELELLRQEKKESEAMALRLGTIAEGVASLVATIPILGLLAVDLDAKFNYPGNATRASRNRYFRRNLIAAYGHAGTPRRPPDSDKALVRCLLLDVYLPDVVASHLFKFAWAAYVEKVLLFSDIDHLRNGLLLYKPIEAAFDLSQLVFVHEKTTGRLVMKLLDRSISNVKLVDVAPQIAEPSKEIQDAIKEIESVTYGDLDGRPLKFVTTHVPFMRCLNFHARRSRLHAIKQKWIPASWDFEDFSSEPKIQIDFALDNYFKRAAEAVPVSEASSSSAAATPDPDAAGAAP